MKKHLSSHRRPTCEKLEDRDLLAAAQNPYQPLDVNFDLFVSPIDALLVINHLNRGSPDDSEGLLDVSGDSFVSPLDALVVINQLNTSQPFLSASLVEDSGAALDLVTNRYELDLLVHNRLARVEACIGGSEKAPFIDISNLFAGTRLRLTEETLDSLAGDQLTDGKHMFEFRFVGDLTGISFEVDVDRNSSLGSPYFRSEPARQGKAKVTLSTEEFSSVEQLAAEDFAIRAGSYAITPVSMQISASEVVLEFSPPGSRGLVTLEFSENVTDPAGNQLEPIVVRYGGETYAALDLPDSLGQIYAQIGDIEGSATDENYDGWLEVLWVDQSAFFVSQERSRSEAEFEEVRLVAKFDQSFPQLAKSLAEGRRISSSEIQFTASVGDGRHEVFLNYEFDDALVTSHELVHSADGEILQVITLGFERIKVTYTELASDGLPGRQTEYTHVVEKTVPRSAPIAALDLPDSLSQVYAQIGDIEGSATDENYDGWLEVLWVDQSAFFVSQERSRSEAEFEEVRLVAKFDQSFPQLAKSLAEGRRISSSEIQFTASVGDGRHEVFLNYEFDDALVTSHELVHSADGEILQVITLGFERIKVTHTELATDGSPGRQTEFSWNRP